jgi:hypothetical protein
VLTQRGKPLAVSGAVFNKEERRILSWSGETLRLWNSNWPRRSNILETACAVLLDHALGGFSGRYGVTVKEPICAADRRLPARTFYAVAKPG